MAIAMSEAIEENLPSEVIDILNKLLGISFSTPRHKSPATFTRDQQCIKEWSSKLSVSHHDQDAHSCMTVDADVQCESDKLNIQSTVDMTNRDNYLPTNIIDVDKNVQSKVVNAETLSLTSENNHDAANCHSSSMDGTKAREEKCNHGVNSNIQQKKRSPTLQFKKLMILYNKIQALTINMNT